MILGNWSQYISWSKTGLRYLSPNSAMESNGFFYLKKQQQQKIEYLFCFYLSSAHYHFPASKMNK